MYINCTIDADFIPTVYCCRSDDETEASDGCSEVSEDDRRVLRMNESTTEQLTISPELTAGLGRDSNNLCPIYSNSLTEQSLTAAVDDYCCFPSIHSGQMEASCL